MKLSLSPAAEKMIEKRLRSKRYASAGEVVQAGLAALELQEAHGDFAAGELMDLLKEGERSIAREGTVPASEVFAELKREGQKLRRRKAG